MAKQKIKIISNPYMELTEFQIEKQGDWQPIAATNPNSALLSESIRTGFFPFKAAAIAETIAREYGTEPQSVRVVFEGPSDEYDEFKLVCESNSLSETIIPEKGLRSLPNARDVLPEIIHVFKETIEPLAKGLPSKNESIERDLKKFTDASSDAVPLCVVGNYSAGKSTFINALIGQELLPTGDQPVTAKVFKIMRSKQRDRGHIAFETSKKKVRLEFDADGLKVDGATECDNLCRAIVEACGKAEKSLIVQMGIALESINHFQPDAESDSVSDLIEVVVPFCASDTWGLARDFVIFDTPGSNSASNADHLRVLREAMEGMSNGMPLFVAEHRSLDSNDNQKLFEEIERIDAMDERFAMIIVNRADEADLPIGEFTADNVHDIMDKAMPKRLFAQGIYFVSSVLGLGAKCDGQLRSYMCAKIYSRAESAFLDPSDRFYTQLYRYNIVPAQIRSRMLEGSQACQNMVLANSGLCCIEQEVELFAEKYSAYDKCGRSESLLHNIAEVTSAELRSAKESRERNLEYIRQTLDKEKVQLLELLEAEGARIEQNSLDIYPGHMEERTDVGVWKISKEELQSNQQRLSAENLSQYEFGVRDEEARAARASAADNFWNGINGLFEKPSMQAIKDIAQQLETDRADVAEKSAALKRARKDADNEAADELIAIVRQRFDSGVEGIKAALDAMSREYWEVRSEQERSALREIATGSEVLSEEKRQELDSIIVQYPALSLESEAGKIFIRPNFERGLRIGDDYLIKLDGLNLEKIRRVYNSSVEDAAEEITWALSKDHTASFRAWVEDLLAQIIDNIEDYNPMLHNYVEIIRDDQARIAEYESKLQVLTHGSEIVSKMIDWTE